MLQSKFSCLIFSCKNIVACFTINAPADCISVLSAECGDLIVKTLPSIPLKNPYASTVCSTSLLSLAIAGVFFKNFSFTALASLTVPPVISAILLSPAPYRKA